MNDIPAKRSVTFQAFDPGGEVDRTERKLPHWFQPGVAVFVTFRTLDSMPRHVVAQWQQELRNWLGNHDYHSESASNLNLLNSIPEADRREFRRLRDQLWHRSLDNCHGACVLRQPRMQEIVSESLRFFDGNRYDLDSFVIMPNHVHLLVQFRHPHTLAKQSASWLRFTARQINEKLRRRGAFWQPEPFDHLVRSAEQFEYLRDYIADNPRRARLKEGEFQYWSRQHALP